MSVYLVKVLDQWLSMMSDLLLHAENDKVLSRSSVLRVVLGAMGSADERPGGDRLPRFRRARKRASGDHPRPPFVERELDWHSTRL